MSTPSSSASSTPSPTSHKRKREIEPIDSDNSESASNSAADDGGTEPISLAPSESALSHAARRKQRKEEKRKLQQNTEASSEVPKKKRKLKDGSAASASKGTSHGKDVKKQNSIWVGNMSFKTAEENLRAFFKDRGVGEVTRVNMPMKAAGGPGLKPENRGFAYVDFDTPEGKKAAIALSEQPLLGRKLLIKDGDDFTGRPNQADAGTITTADGARKTLSKAAQKILKDQKQLPAPTLFFGNLSFETTEDSLQELLNAHHPRQGKRRREKPEGHGETEEEPWIRKVRMGTFEDSGKCKGFAFVDFSSIEHATSALINPKNHHLNGRDLVVEYASPDAVRRGAPKGQKHRPQTDITEKSKQKPKTRRDPPPHSPKTVATPASVEVTRVEATSDNRTPMSRQPEGDHRKARDKGGFRGRPKPGAALALAKRESAAIVPSQGQKITF